MKNNGQIQTHGIALRARIPASPTPWTPGAGYAKFARIRGDRFSITREVFQIETKCCEMSADKSSHKIRLIGIHVAAARELLRMNQTELAEATGIARQTIMRFETGQHEPRPETTEAIREALEERGIEFLNEGKPGVRIDPEKAERFRLGGGLH